METWVKHNVKWGCIFELDGSDDNIQDYGDKSRYSELLDKIEKGQAQIINIEDTQNFKESIKADAEIVWANAEISPLAEQIEDLEDAGKSAAKLRTYRSALKQYKADIYMPNVTRPKLKTGIL